MNLTHLEAYIIIIGSGFLLVMAGIKVYYDLRDEEGAYGEREADEENRD